MSQWITVAAAGEIAVGAYAAYETDVARILVFNLDGTLYALEDLCTHDMSELSGGEFCGEEMTCPRHGALFNVKTGEALTPPAYEPTNTFVVRVTDGVIQIDIGVQD